MPKKQKKDEKKIQVEIVECPSCAGNKVTRNGIECEACQGMGVFLHVGSGGIYYWDEKISGFSPLLRFITELFSKIIRIFIYLMILATFFYGIYFIVINNPDFLKLIQGELESVNSDWIMTSFFLAIIESVKHFLRVFFVLFEIKGTGPLMFWSGTLGMMYYYYHNKNKDSSMKKINPLSSKFQMFYDKNANEPQKPVNIAKYTSPSAKEILLRTLDLSHQKHQSPSALHMAKIIAQDSRAEILLKRLEIDSQKFIKDMNSSIDKMPENRDYNQDGILGGTIMSPEMERIVINSFYETMVIGLEKVEPESLFLALVSNSSVGKYFKDQKIEIKDARNTVLWTRNWSYTKVRSSKPRKIKHSVMNKAWTARVTPELDRFSYDLTDHARSGLTGHVVGRKAELDNLMRILERSSKNNALLIGEEGSGRKSIVKQLANRMVHDQVLPSLQDKRLVVLDIGALVAGARAGGDLELRINNMLADMGKSGNIILFIPDIHNMAAAGSGEGFDASRILSPILAQGLFQIIGTTDFRSYHKYIEPRSDFANAFDMIKVDELDEEMTMKILAIQAKTIEAREGIVMTYGAMKKTVELSKKYITNRILPGKAIDLLSETAVEVRRRGRGSVLRDHDIMTVITEKTGIPLTDVDASEADKLLNLEDNLHERVIGQHEAVKAISSAIRRVRVGMKNENRPIGTFLFLGPTGVGKTELAKALAELYYGDENAMIRVDMSEYQTANSVEKLIGSSSDLNESSSGGFLTEAVKRKPFSLILLDELEKADKNVLNLFLQVFDDGRLTDNLGRTVNFTNTIIIATSNAGSQVIRKIIIDEEGAVNERIFNMLEPYLLKYFAPEFLNRFTAKIVFRSLSEKDIMAIARLQIKSLAKRMEHAQGIKIEISEEALSLIAKMGYSAEYGARYLQRTIQEKAENLIATKFLEGEIKRGDIFEITEKDI
ncbi:ATP-dependent Clp protease ATP-binding subunit [Patescibacteria group bacterium]|nr:ATP-dependent Clp protease ATP-binding subunit [Patescibacteria group bacterium]